MALHSGMLCSVKHLQGIIFVVVINMLHAFTAVWCCIAQMDHVFVHSPTGGHVGGAHFWFLDCCAACVACLLGLLSSFIGDLSLDEPLSRQSLGILPPEGLYPRIY